METHSAPTLGKKNKCFFRSNPFSMVKQTQRLLILIGKNSRIYLM